MHDIDGIGLLGYVTAFVVVALIGIPAYYSYRLLTSGLRGSRAFEMSVLLVATFLCGVAIVPASTAGMGWVIVPVAAVIISSLYVSTYAAVVAWFGQRTRTRRLVDFGIFFGVMLAVSIAMTLVSFEQMGEAIVQPVGTGPNLGRPAMLSVLLLTTAPPVIGWGVILALFLRDHRSRAHERSLVER